MRSIDEVIEIHKNGTIEQKLEVEIEVQNPAIPYLVWSHRVNEPSRNNPRSVGEDRLFVQHLDACHSNIDTIHRYEAEGKRLVHAHIPSVSDKEHEKRLSEIRNHVNVRTDQVKRIREEVLAELGVNEKLAAKMQEKNAKAKQIEEVADEKESSDKEEGGKKK